MDLVSGRPLGSLEPVITEGYEQKLRKVYEAIKTGILTRHQASRCVVGGHRRCVGNRPDEGLFRGC